eukprot:6492719-Amphidinium_carterae.2
MLVQVDGPRRGSSGRYPEGAVYTMEKLKATFCFGKWTSLSAGSDFNGRHLQQVQNEIHVDLKDYMCKLQPIPIEKGEVDRKVVTQSGAGSLILGSSTSGSRFEGVEQITGTDARNSHHPEGDSDAAGEEPFGLL